MSRGIGRFHVGDVRLQGSRRHQPSEGHGMHLLGVAVKKIGPVLANWNKKHAFDMKGVHHVDSAASIELELKGPFSNEH